MYGRQKTITDYMNEQNSENLKQRLGEQQIKASDQSIANSQQELKLRQQKAEKDKIDAALNLLSGAVDEPSYQSAKQMAQQQLGMDVSQLPPSFDPKWVAATQNQLLTAKDRIDNAWEQKKFSQSLGMQGASLSETIRHNKAVENRPTGGAQGSVAFEIMSDNPGMTFTEAYLLGSAKQGQGRVWNPQTRRLELLEGAAPAEQGMAYAKATGSNQSDLEYAPAIARGKAEGLEIGKDLGEKKSDLGNLESTLPQLEEAVAKLGQLGQTATYTKAGQLLDTSMRQSNLPMRQAAIDRAEYISKVDNQILPLLRQTFGAQFTQKEGDSLKITLGDPDKSPQEKDAVLRSFIETKKATIGTLQRRTGAAPAAAPTSKKWVFKDGKLVPAQ